MGRVVQAFILVLVVVLLTGTSITAQETASARVRLIATGGTISNREGGRLTAKELIELVPNLTNYAQVEAEQFANVSSSQLTLCLLYTSPSPRDLSTSRMPSSA